MIIKKDRNLETLSELSLFLRDSVTESHVIVQRTAALNQVPVEYTSGERVFGDNIGTDQFRSELRLGGLLVATGKGSTLKLAKRDAAEKAVLVMKVKKSVFENR